MKPGKAMVLAAGLGLRMRPLTDTRPKPLIEVAGRTMLDRALDHLGNVGVTDAVVNTHYLGQQIADHLAARPAPRIELSPEKDLLDTGGGVVQALPRLGRRPFFVINADIVWRDGPRPALGRLADAWQDDDMDVLMLVHPVVRAVGYSGDGDFHLDPGGRLTRRGEGEIAPFVFAGVQILHPRIIRDVPAGAFSLNLLYDRAATQGRLFGLVHDGEWYHVGTPDGLREAEAELLPRATPPPIELG